jgi:hypothetical protein
VDLGTSSHLTREAFIDGHVSRETIGELLGKIIKNSKSIFVAFEHKTLLLLDIIE